MDSREVGASASAAAQAAARAALAGTRFGAVTWVEETGSTNRDLLERAAQEPGEGLVAVTDHQTAGRGTKGRTWFDPPGGSLLVSVLLRPRMPASRLGLLTIAFGLAAREACGAVAGVEVGLKWPNDLFIGERKLAGILAESRMTGDGVDAVVIGMGMNVNWPADVPVELDELAVALNGAAGHDVDRVALLVAVLRAFEPIYVTLPTPEGQAALLSRYRAASVTIGRNVRIELAAGPVEGRAVDVTDAGHLVVDLAGQRREFASGDVVHLRNR